jgi:nucleoid-associated protein YgaU
MKYYKFLISALLLLLFFSANVMCQEEEMTEEEWQNEINRLTAQKAELTSEFESLTDEVDELKDTDEDLQPYEDCLEELYDMVGASESDVENFQDQLNALTSKIDAKESPKDDRQVELDAMKASKISALPMFYNKVHKELQRKLDAWQEKPKEIMYTVVRGDCLWNIAKKKEHYDNPFAWPKIYKANRDQIKNPDLIYPKQVFKIPNLTEEEKAHYDKIRRNYKPAPIAQD